MGFTNAADVSKIGNIRHGTFRNIFKFLKHSIITSVQ